jgi:hypothetical protein
MTHTHYSQSPMGKYRKFYIYLADFHSDGKNKKVTS